MTTRTTRRGRPSVRAETTAGDSREKLVAAATRLFARYGFNGVTTTMIADEAALTQPMVHYYFRKKEQLWETVIETLVEKRNRIFPLTGNTLADLDPLARLKFLVGMRFEINVIEPYLAMIILHETLSESSRLDWVVENYVRREFQTMNDAAQSAMDAGLIRRISIANLSNLFASAGYLSFAFKTVTESLHTVDAVSDDYRSELRASFTKVLFEGLSACAPPAAQPKSAPQQASFTDRTPASPTSRESDPRLNLIQAAGHLFARYGYGGVTTAQVADRAGLAQSMVNYYFKSKAGLWQTTVERLIQQRRVTFPFVNAIASDLPAIARLKMFVRLLIEANARNPEYGKIFLHEALARGERLVWLQDRYLRDTFKAIDQIGDDAVAAGELLALPPGHLSNILVSAGYHLFGAPILIGKVYRIDTQDDAYINSVSDDFITMLFDGLQTSSHKQ